MTGFVEALEAARATRDTFLQLTPARAERDAERARTIRGPLAAIPFAVKDVFDVAGTRTSGASRLLDYRSQATADAEAVRRITAAGGVCVGKTTLSELAYSGLGVNDRFGTPTIRRGGREYVVGGSSSGAAAAVRAGIVSVALASDTSGSARIPAAWAEVYGFRPSIGRYPGAGMLPLSPTLDTVGIIAADAATLIDVDAVLAREPRRREERPSAKFAVPHDDYLDGCDPAVLAEFHATIDDLRDRGISLEQRRFSALDIARGLHATGMPIVEEEAFAAYGPYLDRHPARLTAAVRRRLERARLRGREHSATPLRNAMSALRARFAEELRDDILLSPTTEIDVPTLHDVRTSAEREDELNSRALRLTMTLSYLDSPSVVLPLSSRARSHTVAPNLQLSARSGRDRRVLVEGARLATYDSRTREEESA
ncbi:amidase [Amycolatopsis acidicola]|uniref:amidase n=1 Tax=Amycolatopsis acidicola TaxID=2596893 RepID=UPI001407B529|nr:amidase family protein [Amycolatopsis acidicola]